MRREGLGESDGRDRAFLKACVVASGKHTVWFCDKWEHYFQVSCAPNVNVADPDEGRYH